MFRFTFCTILLFSTACAPSKGPNTVPVSGKITMKGAPIAGALVVFTPAANDDRTTRLASQAETDADGNYQLQTYVGGDEYKLGVEPGEYVVTVTKLEVIQDMRTKPKHLLPQKYSLPSSTDLVAKVEANSSNSFEFDLK